MHGLATDAALFQALEGLDGLVEGEDPADDGAERAVVDQGGDLAQLVAAGAHEQELVADAELPGLPADPALRAVIARRSTGFRPASRAKAGSGGPAMPMALPPGLSTRRDFSRFFAAEAVQHQVVAAQELFEVLAAVVDDDVGAELAHEVHVGGTCGGRDGRAEMLGELDGDRSDSPGAGVDEDLLPGSHVAALNERLPRGQCDQRQRARLLHADRCGLERKIGLGDGDPLGERADAVLVRGVRRPRRQA